MGKEWQAKPAAFNSDGATHGSRSVSQIRAITSSFGMIDLNAVLAIRDMFKPKKQQSFEANEFEVQILASLLDKLLQYASRG